MKFSGGIFYEHAVNGSMMLYCNNNCSNGFRQITGYFCEIADILCPDCGKVLLTAKNSRTVKNIANIEKDKQVEKIKEFLLSIGYIFSSNSTTKLKIMGGLAKNPVHLSVRTGSMLYHEGVNEYLENKIIYIKHEINCSEDQFNQALTKDSQLRIYIPNYIWYQLQHLKYDLEQSPSSNFENATYNNCFYVDKVQFLNKG